MGTPDPRPPFHLAFTVQDLASTRAFYGDLLGCLEGRSAERWVDFDFHGHQISAHCVDTDAAEAPAAPTNPVDGDQVPARHFGCILPWDAWEALAGRLEAAEADFILRPRIRFEGSIGEQATLFVRDPSGNALEFKAFRDEGTIFARESTPDGSAQAEGEPRSGPL